MKLLAFVILIAFFVGIANADLIFEDGYESGDESQWDWFCSGSDGGGWSNHFAIVESPVRDANSDYAGQITVHGTDVDGSCGGTSNQRTEVGYDGITEGGGDEYYYAWSTYINSGTWTNPASWAIFMQWHAEYPIKPAASILFNPSNYVLVDQCRGNQDGTSSCNDPLETTVITNFQFNTWHDFIVHAKWEFTSSGVFELWHKTESQEDYTKVYTYNGTTLPYKTNDYPDLTYKQYGLYRGQTSGTSIIYQDNFRIGETWADVTEEAESSPSPIILSWGNNFTNNQSLDFTIEPNQYVNFNATANQTISTWSWSKDGNAADNNYDNYSTYWGSSGSKTLTVYGINANGSTQTVQWNVTVSGTAEESTGEYVIVTLDTNTTLANQVILLNGFDISITDDMWLNMNHDGNDTFFTSLDGQTTYPHYIDPDVTWTQDDYLIYVKIVDNDVGHLRWYLNNESAESTSNGPNTFLEFFDGDNTGWTEVDPNSRIAFTNDRLQFTALTRNEIAYVYQAYSPPTPDDVVIEHTWDITASDSTGVAFGAMLLSGISTYYSADWGVGHEWYYSGSADAVALKMIDGAGSEGSDGGFSLNTQYWSRMYLNNSATHIIYTDSTRETETSSSSISISDLSETMNYIYLLNVWNSGSSASITGWVDNFRVYKYVSPSPVPTDYSAIQEETVTDVITFISPTPDNTSTIYVNYALINVSLSTSNMTFLNFSWNGTNTSYYDDTLIVMYNFDNQSDIGDNIAQMVDLSGIGYSVFYTEAWTATWTENGKYNGAMELDDVNDFLVRYPSPDDENVTGFTVSAWFNVSDETDGIQPIVACNWWAESPYGGFSFAVYSDGTLRAGTVGGLTYCSYCSNGGAVTNNTWYYATLVWNGTHLMIYKNAVLQDIDAITGNFSFGEYNLYLGYEGFNYYGGIIDEVRIWDRALTHAEVTEQYKSNLAKQNETQWYFETNQTSLEIGTYTYQAFMNDVSSDFMTFDVSLPNTKFEYYNGSGWDEGEAYDYIYLYCWWWDSSCDNADQTTEQPSLKITNNGTSAGIPYMYLNTTCSNVDIYARNSSDYTGGVVLNTSSQAVSSSIAVDANVTLWAGAALSGADDCDFEVYAEVLNNS